MGRGWTPSRSASAVPLRLVMGTSISSTSSQVANTALPAINRATARTRRTSGSGTWTIGPDHIEVGSFIGLAAITGSDITIDAVKQADLVSILHAFEKVGVRVEQGENFVRVPPRQELFVQDDLGGHVPKIEDGPWPAFPSDL